MFCGGLKPEIWHDVLAMAPISLSHAQSLARRYEAKLNDIKVSTARSQRPHSWSFVPRQQSGTSSSFSSPHHQTYANPTTTLSPSNSTTPHRPTQAISQTQRPHNFVPYRRLTPSEQRERRAKNLCFNCDEQYSDTHVCKKPFMAILESLVTTPQRNLWNFMTAQPLLMKPTPISRIFCHSTPLPTLLSLRQIIHHTTAKTRRLLKVKTIVNSIVV